MKDDKKENIERLDQIIISTTLSRAGFSDLIGISRQLLNKYLNGDNDIQKITKKLRLIGKVQLLTIIAKSSIGINVKKE